MQPEMTNEQMDEIVRRAFDALDAETSRFAAQAREKVEAAIRAGTPRLRLTLEDYKRMATEGIAKNEQEIADYKQMEAEHPPISPKCFMCDEFFIAADRVDIAIQADDNGLCGAYHQSCMDEHNKRQDEAYWKNPE